MDWWLPCKSKLVQVVNLLAIDLHTDNGASIVLMLNWIIRLFDFSGIFKTGTYDWFVYCKYYTTLMHYKKKLCVQCQHPK